MVAFSDLQRATEAVYRVAHPTPLLAPASLSRDLGGDIRLKAECLQHTGSFKVRGAANKLASLTRDERTRGVITASAGNHAQGVAVAARAVGVQATVVMPEGAPLSKVQATRSYSASVILHGFGFADAVTKAEEMAREESLVYVSGFDDAAVIAGQGSLGLEIAADCPDVDLVLVPVGGGGLVAGVAIALKEIRPSVRIVGVQAAASPAAAVSRKRGRRVRVLAAPTLADGVAVPQPGRLTWPLIQNLVDDIVVVDEELIAQAIVLLLERARLVVEGAGALGVAALLGGKVKAGRGPTVALLSGGNIDINVLATVVQHGLLHAGRYLTLTVDFDDRPGMLASVLAVVAATGANVIEVSHVRQGIDLPLRGVEVRLLLETRDQAHIEDLAAKLAAAGYAQTASDRTSRSFRPNAWSRI